MGTIHSSRLPDGAIFLSTGAVTVTPGLTDRMLPAPRSEIFNIYEVVIQRTVEDFLASPLVGFTL